MKRDFQLGIEKLDNKVLLSSVPWYISSIDADKVWSSVPKMDSGSKPIVAIVDSGLDFNHNDLKNDVWTNPLEIAGNNKDDDNNGYVDDIHGWNFTNNSNIAQDNFYHGTHLAGIVSGVSNHSVSLLPLKFINDNGSGYVGFAVAAINYAVNLKLKGFNVAAINCSFGGLSVNNISLSNAIQKASDNNIVVVLAAGNGGVDIDVNPRYPGSLSYNNTITVGSSNQDNTLASYSNYGKNSVTVAAPGSNIYSTLPGNSYGYVSGSSMSAAIVSGEVGLLSALGRYGASQIKNVIMQGCEKLVGLVDKVKSGLVNVLNSWNLLKIQSVPSQVENKLVYYLTTVNSRIVQGWAKMTTGSFKPIVEVRINGVLRYVSSSNLYRSETKSFDGFKITIDKKFLNQKKNLLEIRIKDSKGIYVVCYKNYI